MYAMISTKSGPKNIEYNRFIVKIFKNGVLLGVRGRKASRQEETGDTNYSVKHKETDNERTVQRGCDTSTTLVE